MLIILDLSAAEFCRRASRKRIRAAAAGKDAPAEICERRRRRFFYGAPAARRIP